MTGTGRAGTPHQGRGAGRAPDVGRILTGRGEQPTFRKWPLPVSSGPTVTSRPPGAESLAPSKAEGSGPCPRKGRPEAAGRERPEGAQHPRLCSGARAECLLLSLKPHSPRTLRSPSSDHREGPLCGAASNCFPAAGRAQSRGRPESTLLPHEPATRPVIPAGFTPPPRSSKSQEPLPSPWGPGWGGGGHLHGSWSCRPPPCSFF